ncbi:MAG: hypothetical protein MZU91_13015 [Desulfosudis oleivorans]|nr:hypothetical protein [Desulfosudis oleivorans]
MSRLARPRCSVSKRATGSTPPISVRVEVDRERVLPEFVARCSNQQQDGTRIRVEDGPRRAIGMA